MKLSILSFALIAFQSLVVEAKFAPVTSSFVAKQKSACAVELWDQDQHDLPHAVTRSKSRASRNRKTEKSLLKKIRGGVIEKLKLKRETAGFAISLVLSLIYTLVLLSRPAPEEGSPPACFFTKDGFCVTGLNDDRLCPGGNSHLWSWNVDVVFTILALAIGTYTGAGLGTTIPIALVIFGHGYLHKSFDNLECKSPTGGAANVVYAVFIAAVSWLATETAAIQSMLLKVAIIVLGTGVTVYLSQPKRGLGVSPIFMYTQLLVSFSGLSMDPPNQLMGDLFIIPCLVSILEVFACCGGDGQGFFNKIGGHVWYDFFLHLSMLAVFKTPNDAIIA